MEDLYIHYGFETLDVNRFKPISNYNSLINKPKGGLWASPVNARYGWKDFVDNELEDDSLQNKYRTYFVFKLQKNAKVLHVETSDEVKFIVDNYSKIIFQDDAPGWSNDILTNWEAVAKDYDAVEIIRNDLTHDWFYTWDVDSLLVFNPNIIIPQDKSVLEESVLSDWDYKTQSISDENPKDAIDTRKTGMSFYDDLIPGSSENEYMAEQKNLKGEIVMMSPSEYYKACATKIFSTTVDSLKRQRIAYPKGEIAELMDVIVVQKKKFPLPIINYAQQSQEGLHRMYALGELFGWDEKFPVLSVNWVSEERHQKEMIEQREREIWNKLHSAVTDALYYEYDDLDEFKTELNYKIKAKFMYDDELKDADFELTRNGNKCVVTMAGVDFEFDYNDININENKTDVESDKELDDIEYDDLDISSMDADELDIQLDALLKNKK